MSSETLDRRAFVTAGLATIGTAGAVGNARTPPPTLELPPRDNRPLVKLMASLDETAAPWWFAGYIYAIQLGRRPVPMVRFEGCEIYFPLNQPDGSVLARAATLTFFQDVATGDWLEQIRNPITGKINEVKPNRLSSSPRGGMLYPADGSAPHITGVMGSSGQLNYKPPTGERQQAGGELSWSLVGDRVHMTRSHGVDTPAQPWLEVTTVSGEAAAVADPTIASVAAVSGVTYASPWMKWMDMDDVPGHLMWHAGSHKLSSLDGLPRRYRERAERGGLLDTLAPPKD